MTPKQSNQFVWLLVEMREGGPIDFHGVFSSKAKAQDAKDESGLDWLVIWCWQVNGDPAGEGRI